MAHLHEVRDADTHYIIDPLTMTISNANDAKNKLRQGDHGSEIYTFELPKVIEGHDMTLCDKVEVHFINISSDKADKYSNVYTVKDMHVDEVESDKLLFTYTIESGETTHEGGLWIRILFACTSDGVYTYKKWTEIYKDFSIGEGFENTTGIIAENTDLLTEWKAELEQMIASGGGTVTKESIETALGYTPADAEEVRELSETIDDLSYNDLKDRPFYSYDGDGKVVYSDIINMPTSGNKSLTSEPFDIVVGDKYKVTWNGTEYVCVARKASLLLDESIMDVFQLGNRGIKNALVPSEDTGEPFLFEWGYVNGVFSGFIRGTKEIDVIIEVAHIPTEYVPLQTEYLPEGVPYLSKNLVELLPETETNTLPSDDGSAIIGGLELFVDETYIVTLNGTDYECVGQDLSVMQEGAVLIGNPSVFEMGDNGLPFVIVALPGIGGVFMELNGKLDNTLSIHKGTVKKRKLPKELLPDGVLTEADKEKIVSDVMEQIEIPSGGDGGSSEWRYIGLHKVEECCNPFIITKDTDGNPIGEFTEVLIFAKLGYVKLNSNVSMNRGIQLSSDELTETHKYIMANTNYDTLDLSKSISAFDLSVLNDNTFPIVKVDSLEDIDYTQEFNTLYRYGTIHLIKNGNVNTMKVANDTGNHTGNHLVELEGIRGFKTNAKPFTKISFVLGLATNYVLKGSSFDIYVR